MLAFKHVAMGKKVATQLFKSGTVNAWIALRQIQKQDLLDTRELVKGLEQYCNALNRVESFPDFIHELTPELISHAKPLEKPDDTSVNRGKFKGPAPVKKTDLKKLVSKANARKRYRLSFLNGPYETALRTNVQRTDHVSA